jgi:hypothetical protein
MENSSSLERPAIDVHPGEAIAQPGRPGQPDPGIGRYSPRGWPRFPAPGVPLSEGENGGMDGTRTRLLYASVRWAFSLTRLLVAPWWLVSSDKHWLQEILLIASPS